MKVVVLDNEELARKGTTALIKQVANVDVVAEYARSEQLVDHLRREFVSLIVMEWRLLGSDGLETIARVLRAYPKTKLLILSSHLTGPFPAHIWEMGVAGLISRGDSFSEFKAGIKDLLAGKRFIGAEVSKYMFISKYVDKDVSPFDSLTERETQVLMMLVDGVSAQDIAERLCITKKTVNTYRYRLFEKLNVKNDVDLTRLAWRHGVLIDAGGMNSLLSGQCLSDVPSRVH